MLCFMGHSMMENRSGLIVQADLTRADGHAERRAAIDMLHRHSRLCCTNRVRDSSRESSMVAGVHEQTHIPDLQDQELAGL